MGYAAAVALLAALVQEKNEAEQLFHKMDQQITKAKTLQVAVTVTLEGAKEGKFEGTLALAQGNKARLKLKGDLAGKQMDLEMVSDGSRLRTSSSGGKQNVEDTPKKLNDTIAGPLGRAGLFAPLMSIRRAGPKQDEFDPEKMFRLSGFKLGKKDKVGGRDAQAVEYQLALPEGPTFQAVVWLDAQTALPLRRTLTASKDGERITVTEVYRGLRLDAALDAKTFELPK
jgi:outer membrane lipoprotein-sorting protein